MDDLRLHLGFLGRTLVWSDGPMTERMLLIVSVVVLTSLTLICGTYLASTHPEASTATFIAGLGTVQVVMQLLNLLKTSVISDKTDVAAGKAEAAVVASKENADHLRKQDAVMADIRDQVSDECMSKRAQKVVSAINKEDVVATAKQAVKETVKEEVKAAIKEAGDSQLNFPIQTNNPSARK